MLPDGPAAINGTYLKEDYYEKGAVVVEIQIARAGVRLAAWLDLIASAIKSRENIQDL